MGELRAAAVTGVDVVVPYGIDDPARPSGGNAYDRRICDGLAAIGWTVREHAVPGTWPHPDAYARTALGEVVSGLADRAVVLIDGLIASTAPDVLAPEARRIQLVVLVHMPLGQAPEAVHLDGVADRERAVLAAAAGIVTTSAWTRQWLVDQYQLPPAKIHVAEPGVDTAAPAPGTSAGGELLCVAALSPHKGHEVLLSALAMIADVPWRLVCVGSVSRDPEFVARLERQVRADGLADRVRFVGVRAGADLDDAYAGADALVLASYAETYGMVVTEALARALPVLATAVGGVPGALGCAADGMRPGLLVPPGDPAAFAEALRAWLDDGQLRARLRHAAARRRTTLSGWPSTVDRVSRALAGRTP